MRDHWYPLVFSRDLKTARPTGISLLGAPLVLFRDQSGKATCLEDRCPHRSVPLSLGRVVDGKLECKYHGWQFGSSGGCVHIPSLAPGAPIPKASSAVSYPVHETMGLVWVFPGDPAEADPGLITYHREINDPGCRVVDGYRDFDMDHGLMIENLLDPSHLPFTHEGTLAKRKDAQPIEVEMVDYPRGLKARFHRRQDPALPVQTTTFDAPCEVRLDISLGRGDMRLIQVHYSVPLARRRMRLFWRMIRNFASFAPGIRFLIARLSNRIIDQDVAMLAGQQERLDQGAKAWACPVKADGLAVRYRAYRERVETPDVWFQGFSAERASSGLRDKSRLRVV